jgi:beta-galactosidase
MAGIGKTDWVMGQSNWVTGQSNDHIFPPADAAKKYISFDARGFLVNGKRTFLVSAGLEYARIPHELWYDRLLRLKRCGFNCIEIYTFWNFHEPEDGKFNFSGDRDLNKFLQLVKQLDLYAIVRVGPYYCAEWDGGGYPVWLRFKDNLMVREPNKTFEKYMDRFFDTLLPVVFKNQINKGGAVVMVQLENEHPASWGTFVPNEYFQHLQDKALSKGLEVPYFFSGLHHGGDPAGNARTFDDTKRPNPWFTTEFWSVWYNLYGSGQKEADTYGRRTWNIIADGGNGYNYYMAYGGTNFGYTNSHEDAACYDYGAAVGQTGDPRPIYYQFKRNALFARSFQDILENSTDADLLKEIVTDTAIHTKTRHSGSGDILFLDNHGLNPVSTQLNIDNQSLPSGGPLTLSPGEIMPVVHNFQLTPGVVMDWAVTRILGISRQGNTTTLVAYGPADSNGELWFSPKQNITVLTGAKAFNVQPGKSILKFTFDSNQPVVYSFKCGAQVVRILTVNNSLSDRTWLVDNKGKQYVITGPEYVAETETLPGNHEKITTEHFWNGELNDRVWLYSDGINQTTTASKTPETVHQVKLAFDGNWQVKNVSAAAATDFDDSKWKASETALPMGADGDTTAMAWYRTIVHIKDAGDYKLNINKGDRRFIVFVDNVRVAAGGINELQFKLSAGTHQLAIFAAHDGRDKLYSFLGKLQDVDIKGISGDVLLHKGNASYVTDWKMVKMPEGKEATAADVPSFDNAVPYRIGEDAFNQKHGYAWFRAVIPVENGRIPVYFNFRSVDDKAIVYINGKEAGRVNDWNTAFSAPLTGDDNSGKPVILTVFLENRNGAGGIDKPVEIIYKDDILVKGWHMKGGLDNFNTTSGWKTMQANEQFDRPSFFRNTFTVNPTVANSHPVWRVTFEGLSHGFIFINGHNLGGYPERVPVSSLYIPECWLHKGVNTIVVYDQYGNRADNIEIAAEMVASRDVETAKF